jgi:hypothetical protein
MLMLMLSSPLWAQRGGGGRGGARGSQAGALGQPQGPMADRAGPSAPDRQRIRATDRQRVEYQNLAQAASRLRSRARQMVRLAKKAGVSYELLRTEYVELQNELPLAREQQEAFTAGLSQEQRVAVQKRSAVMEKDLDELNVWMEAMDEELKQSEPEPRKLEQQSRQVEKAAKKWQDDSRHLASDLSIP